LIVLDTSVVSLALRRRKPDLASPALRALGQLIEDEADLGLPGIVVQEILSGVRRERDFHRLRTELEHFEVLLAAFDEHVLAARIVNDALNRGLALKSIDALIAAQTIARSGQLFTLDRDFKLIAADVGLTLFEIDDYSTGNV
jgi:predicted nucleic acid-binding protein